MTDQSPAPAPQPAPPAPAPQTPTAIAPELPTYLQNLTVAFAQKGVAMLAIWLTSQGFLPQASQDQFDQSVMGVVLLIASVAWTLAHEHGRTVTAQQALNAPPPARQP